MDKTHKPCYSRGCSDTPELIIHIGSPKTGSSSLQWAFKNNTGLLRSESVFYPVYMPRVRYGRSIDAHINKEVDAKVLQIDQQRQETFKKETEKFAKRSTIDFTNGHYKKMLISEEMMFDYLYPRTWLDVGKKITPTTEQISKLYNELTHYKALRLRHLYDGFKIKIICYLRRQDLFVESYYNQDIKNIGIQSIIDRVETYNEFFECQNKYDFGQVNINLSFNAYYQYRFITTYYYKILNIWADVFGKENVIVKPFEKVTFKEGLVKDFFTDVLNIAPDKLDSLKEKHANERIGRDVLEYLNGLDQRSRYLNSTDLTEISQKLGDVNRYQEYFNREERLRLLEYHKEGNEKIAREYLGRENGILFYDQVSAEEPEPYPGLTDEKRAILDEEFRRLERISIENHKLTKRVERILSDTKSCAENVISIENHNCFIRTLKVYGLAVSIISQKLMSSIKRKTVRHTMQKLKPALINADRQNPMKYSNINENSSGGGGQYRPMNHIGV